MDGVWNKLIVWIIAAVVIIILIAWLVVQFKAGNGGMVDVFRGSIQTGDQLSNQVG